MGKKDKKQSATEVVKEIKRQTRRKFTAEEKIKIVLEGMRGEVQKAECLTTSSRSS